MYQICVQIVFKLEEIVFVAIGAYNSTPMIVMYNKVVPVYIAF